MVTIPVEPPVTEYLHNKAARLHIPLSGTFELTPVCNMDCRMCYVRMSKAQQEAAHPLLTVEQWLDIGEQGKKQGLLYLLLTGGEPFLRPDFRQILGGLHRMGFIISINTNGTLIDADTVQWLKQTPPVRINLTLYGASDATYERLCGNPHGFTQATRAIQLLREAGISVKINCSVTPYNAEDLDAIFDYCRQQHLVIQATSYMFPPMRKDPAKIGRNDRLSPEQAAYYAAKVECLLNGEEEFLRRIQENDSMEPLTDSGADCLETEGEGVRCRAGKCSFWVTWDGKLFPCGMLTCCGGDDLLQVGFQQAWQRAVSDIAAVRLPARCSGCALQNRCRACAAMVYTESGDLHTVPDYRCRMTHAYSDACHVMAEEIRKRGTADHA